MKPKRNIAALLLSLILLFPGCATPPDSPTETPSTESTVPEENSNIHCQYLPKNLDSPGDIPVLKWVCLTSRLFGGGTRTWNETAAQELNQMLADQNMPFRVQFVLLTMDEFLLDSTEWLALPEAQEALKDADLIYSGMGPEEMVNYLMPITEYVTGTAEPTLKNAVPHELYWIKGTVKDQIYGYCTHVYTGISSSGWTVKQDLLTKAGLSAEDFNRDFWEMDEVFAKLYAANGNQPFLDLQVVGQGVAGSQGMFGREVLSAYPGSVNNVFPKYYDGIGACFVIDYSAETPAVLNYLETDMCHKIQEAALRYVKAEYTTEDSSRAQVFYGTVNAHTLQEENNEFARIPRTKNYFSATEPVGFINGVAAVSKHPAEAVALLNLIAENEAFRMQLLYGKEGRDYKIEDGYYTLITQADGSDYSLDFLSPLAYFCGLTCNEEKANMKSPGTENWQLIPQEGKTALQTYQDILDDSVFFYPILFDYTGFEQELEAIQAILRKYFPAFVSEQMVGEQYDQMLQELKDAGSEKLLTELQRQLTQWQTENPVWQSGTDVSAEGAS